VKKSVLVWAVSIAVGALAPSGLVFPAAENTDSRSAEQDNISEQKLRDFAKTYVAFQKIRLAYEDAARQSRDIQEQRRAQHEALIEIDAALQRQGLEYEAFAQILENMNTDETLRAKTMKLIEEERRASG
jgi:phosphoenolpyruvate carboxylase